MRNNLLSGAAPSVRQMPGYERSGHQYTISEPSQERDRPQSKKFGTITSGNDLEESMMAKEKMLVANNGSRNHRNQTYFQRMQKMGKKSQMTGGKQ
jgi:hypothetical protein